MEQLAGIGGVFFKAKNPDALGSWYHEKLGLPMQDGFGRFIWRQPGAPEKSGRTEWCLFEADSDYFKGNFMINYRVTNMDRMLAQLREQGVTIEKTEDVEYGRFAWVIDPEGNRVELWEPIGE